MPSREGEEPGHASSAFSAPSTETAESERNSAQQQQQRQRPATMQPHASTQPPPQYGDLTALLNMLRSQVEFYFSPQNLGRDSYLRNMLSDASSSRQQHQPTPPPPNMALCTPIEVICNFPKVWNICASFGMPEPPAVLVNKALQGSAIVTISNDGGWIGPTSQSLPPFTKSSATTPSSPSPSHGPPMAVIPPQYPYNMSPYPPPPPQMMMMPPMQQPPTDNGPMMPPHPHQSFPPPPPPPPYYMGPPPPNNSNNANINSNRPLSAGSSSPSSASLEDAGSIPSQTKESSKISMASVTSGASLSSLSEQPSQVPTMPQQQPQPQYGAHNMMGQQYPQQFMSPPYGMPMYPYPPYYNPQQPPQQQQQQQMPPPNFMPPPRYGGPPPPRGGGGGHPPPYPYPGMMPPPPPPPPPHHHHQQQQYGGGEGGYPPPHPHGYPSRHHQHQQQQNINDSSGHKRNDGTGYKKKKKNNFDKKRNNGGGDSNYGYRSPSNFGQQQQSHQQQPFQNYGGANNRYSKQPQHSKKDPPKSEKESVVFNPGDFPGLDGKSASESGPLLRSSATSASSSSEDPQRQQQQRLVGYASALLKKNEKGASKATTPSHAASILQDEVDDTDITQQTEAMEKEILSEFHDLSIRGGDPDESIDNNNKQQYGTVTASEDKMDGSSTVETSPTSTENGLVSPQSATTNGDNLPILPEPVNNNSSSNTNEQPPPTNTEHEKPRVDLEEEVGGENDRVAPPPPPPTNNDVVDQPPPNDNKVGDEQKNTEVDKPKVAAPAAWGSKRLFADVVASQK